MADKSIKDLSLVNRSGLNASTSFVHVQDDSRTESDEDVRVPIGDFMDGGIAVASQAEAEAGSETSVRQWTPERISQAIAALSSGGGGSFNPVEAEMLMRRSAAAAAGGDGDGGDGDGGGGGAIWLTPFGFSTIGKYYDNILDQGYIASANLRKYSQLDTTSGDGESSIMQCAIPPSATSIDTVTLYLSANSTTEPTIDIYCAMRGEGETYNQGTFSNLTGQSSWYTQGGSNLLEYVDIAAQFSLAAGGDQIAIGVKRTGGSNQCYVIGCLLEYS